ncbi:MAG: hypothetical protein KKD05_00305 [Candidatus Omnitrophica bacterium]|nr:hypothetical protein [Candidatus Omnitrophota bacterium]
MKIKPIILSLLIILLLPAVCFADGGGPILLLINVYAFSLGQVWIIAAEFAYLFLLLKNLSLSKLKILEITFVMNLLSTLLGAMLFPLLLAIVTLPGVFYMNTKWGGLLMAMGTWVAGDHSPHSNVAIAAAAVGFFITFFLTVWIEYQYLKQLAQKQQIKVKFKHCVYFNLISYAGLIVLFFSLNPFF